MIMGGKVGFKEPYGKANNVWKKSMGSKGRFKGSVWEGK